MNKLDLVNIINSFASEGIVFSNEQDFQFALGTKIKGLKCVKNVFFEVISLDSTITFSLIESNVKKSIKYKLPRSVKQYHDLLVELDNQTFVMIELKYKSPGKICLYETLKGKFITFIQGAYDLGAYDFLNDIQRLETINSRNLLNDIKISKSFSILLTNDRNYRFNDFRRSKIWTKYSLCETYKTKGSGVLTFKEGSLTYKTKGKTYSAVELKNIYDIEWLDYKLTNINTGKLYDDYKDCENSYHPGFSYLIFEINKTSKEGD